MTRLVVDMSLPATVVIGSTRLVGLAQESGLFLPHAKGAPLDCDFGLTLNNAADGGSMDGQLIPRVTVEIRGETLATSVNLAALPEVSFCTEVGAQARKGPGRSRQDRQFAAVLPLIQCPLWNAQESSPHRGSL